MTTSSAAGMGTLGIAPVAAVIAGAAAAATAWLGVGERADGMGNGRGLTVDGEEAGVDETGVCSGIDGGGV